MPSITTKWKQFVFQHHRQDTTAAKAQSDMDSSALKSVIKSNLAKSPKIGMMTHDSDNSIDMDSIKKGTSSNRKSLSDIFHDHFVAFSGPVNNTESEQDEISHVSDIQPQQQPQQRPQQEAEQLQNLPTNLLIPSTLALNRSFVGNASCSSSVVMGPSMTCGSEYHDKWPAPETIEQVKTLCETEKAEGNSQSQLALCLHLMESAWQVDPHNDMVLSPTATSTTVQPHNLFATLLPINHEHRPAPNTLGEAMVTEARQILKQLAISGQTAGQSGEAEAQFLLASCYGMGALGWPVNHYRAFQWYNQASKQNHAEATYRTAVCYELGIGTEKDGDRAVIFYKKAAHLLHVPSMYKLGVILMRGYCNYPISKREAVVWLQRAAATAVAPLAPGDDATTIGGAAGVALPHALHALAIIQLTRECEDTSMLPDDAYAIKLLHNAARLGYAPSQSKLGECYECGQFCPEDETQSIYWYTLAAKQDYPEACLALSGWYLTGSLKTSTLMQSDQQAYLWARKAASLAKRVHRFKELTAKAYYTLGMYNEHGIGVPKSIEVSTKWYRKAANHGHPDALLRVQNNE